MARNRPLLEAPILIGVGAAFDIHAGVRKRAPVWMQKSGLEWLFRLSQEPARLAPRYLRNNSTFAFLLASDTISSLFSKSRKSRVA
jgi:N-acetylglucosaminyldiphosphoundecaprenol N-acetyl-beta-D-mannosaminyltransferase